MPVTPEKLCEPTELVPLDRPYISADSPVWSRVGPDALVGIAFFDVSGRDLPTVFGQILQRRLDIHNRPTVPIDRMPVLLPRSSSVQQVFADVVRGFRGATLPAFGCRSPSLNTFEYPGSLHAVPARCQPRLCIAHTARINAAANASSHSAQDAFAYVNANTRFGTSCSHDDRLHTTYELGRMIEAPDAVTILLLMLAPSKFSPYSRSTPVPSTPAVSPDHNVCSARA